LLEDHLATVLGVPKRCVTVVAGHGQPNKTIAIDLPHAADVMQRLPPK